MPVSKASTSSVRLMIAVVVVMLCVAAWVALHRTARIDDSAPMSDQARLPDMRVDINSASAAELALLPGIGPALADRIVADRETHGPFKTVDELDRVKGVGSMIIQRLRPWCVAQMNPESH